jgi:Mrp family chromosome partitioning ATPase
MFADSLSSRDGLGETSPYRGLIYRVFQPRSDALRGAAIAVTSPHYGAGTSYVVRSLAAELASYAGNRILQVDLATLAGTLRNQEELIECISQTSVEGIFEIAYRTINGTGPATYWHANIDHRRACIDTLRQQFQYVIFDCPAVLESGETLGIAPLIDGIFLVIESDKTTRDEVAETERQIESGGGRIYGTILNKQKTGRSRWTQRKG